MASYLVNEKYFEAKILLLPLLGLLHHHCQCAAHLEGDMLALFQFLCGPSKPPISPPQAMTSVTQGALQAPQQAILDLDSYQFLIDSGASTHMWNRRKDFILHHPLNKEEQTCDQVLRVSSTAILPMGIGTIQIKVDDDLNNAHMWLLHDARHLPNAPLIIFVPWELIQ